MGNKYIKHKLMLGLGKVNRKAYEKVRFLLLLKRWPNIKKPQTINEWLLHRKINQIYSNPELSGTIESYQYAQKIDPNIKIPTVVETIFNSKNIDVLKKLSNGSYILKGSHGSGMIKIIKVDQGRLRPKYNLVKQYIIKWLQTSFADISGEYCYNSAKPAVIVEKLLDNEECLASDIKVHCKNGIPKVVQYINRSSGKLIRFTWGVKNGVLFSINLFKNEMDEPPIIEDEILKLSIERSKKLSKDFEYVRVDFMISKKEMFFSELTFFPAGCCMPLISHKKDKEFYNIIMSQ